MSRQFGEDCRRQLQRACTNIIGFGNLVEDPCHPTLTAVRRLQYSAYMTGSALKLADLVIANHRLLAEVYSRDQASDFRGRAQGYKSLLLALDGDCPADVQARTMEFARYFLGVFSR